jgi:undecaprenyl-diphosphatase
VTKNFNANLKEALTTSFVDFPSWATQTLVNVIALSATLSVLLVIVAALVRRRPRFLLVAFAGSAIALVMAGLLSPSAVALDEETLAILRELNNVFYNASGPRATALSTIAVLAGLAGAWLGRTWARWFWTLLVAYSLVWVLGTEDSPASVLIAIGAGVMGAGIASYVHGRPNLRPRGAQIAADFARAGLPLASLKVAAVDARGSTPYFGTAADGREVFIKVLAEDERSSDLLFRAYRYVRFKNLGDLRPFSSLRRAVEHEALVALWASANDIRTPAVAAVATVGDDGIGLAYERIDGKSLDGVDDLTQNTLEGSWRLIAQLREHGIAHRDLRLANVFLAADGEPWMIDFGFSEMAATDQQLRSDIVEFLASTTAKVGVERAVAACVDVVGNEALADAAPRLQPTAMSTATRKALAEQAGLLEQLQGEVVRVTGIARIDFEKLDRAPRKRR